MQGLSAVMFAAAQQNLGPIMRQHKDDFRTISCVQGFSEAMTEDILRQTCWRSGSGAKSPIPIGSIVAAFCGSFLGSYKVIPKRNYNGAYTIVRLRNNNRLSYRILKLDNTKRNYSGA